MPDDKPTTPPEVAHYDPKRAGPGTVRLAKVPTDEEGVYIQIHAPEGMSDEDVKHVAMEYAHTLRRIRESWVYSFTPEQLEAERTNLLKATAILITQQLLGVVQERYGYETLARELGYDPEAYVEDGEDNDPIKDLAFEVMERSIQRQLTVLKETLDEEGLNDIVRDAHQAAATNVVIDVEREHGDPRKLEHGRYDELLGEAFNKGYEGYLYAERAGASENLTYAYLEQLEVGAASLEQLLVWLGVASLPEEAAPVLPTPVAIPKEPRVTTDLIARGFTDYVGGREEAREAMQEIKRTEGYKSLLIPRSRGQYKGEAHLKEGLPKLLSISNGESARLLLERIIKDRNETKAKLLLALMAYSQEPNVNPEGFIVAVADLMRLVFNYERSGERKTNSRLYNRERARLIRYALVDLPGIMTSIQVILPGHSEPYFSHGALINPPRIINRQEAVGDDFYSSIAELSVSSDDDVPTKLIDFVKHLDPVMLEIGFPRDTLVVLGLARHGGHQPAVEGAQGIFELKGTAFWLGTDIIFMRRWKKDNAKPAAGKPLLDVLKEGGYLEAARRRHSGSRVSYKSALRGWLDDVDKLASIGLLESDQKATLHARRKGRWLNITKEIEQLVATPRRHITEEILEGVRVKYWHNRSRLRELEPVREKQKAHKKRAKTSKARAGQ